MSQPVTTHPSPPTSSLVEQWYELLNRHTVSALSAPTLKNELRTLAEELLQTIQQEPPLTEAQHARLVAAGQQLAELGVRSSTAVAGAQAALARWLQGNPAPLMDEVLAAFYAGIHQVLEQRAVPARPEPNQTVAQQLMERERGGTLLSRIVREIGRGASQEQTVATVLAMLHEGLEAKGAGYLEWEERGWVLSQSQGTVPPSLVPYEGPRLPAEASPRYHQLPELHQFLFPVALGEAPTAALLLLIPQERLAAPLALMESLAPLGPLLRAATRPESGTSPRRKGTRPLDGGGRATNGQAPVRRLGMTVDESDEAKMLSTLPVATPAIDPQRVVLPLASRGEPFGRLMLEDDQEHDWSEDELELMSVVAEQMAQALETARLFQESHRRAAQLAAAAEVSRAASSLLTLEDLMDTAVEQIRNTFGYYHAQVFLIDDEGKWALLRSSTGEVGQKLLARRHKLAVGSKSIIGQVTSSARPTVVRDTDTGESAWRFNELLPQTRAELAVPLQVGTRVIGALDVQSTSPDVFYEDDIVVLQTLADQMAIAIENARAYERQREATEQLRELDKLKTQFLANMSHELRTPLNSIIGFSRVILKGIDGPVTDLQKKDLTTIYNSGQILLQLIDSILDISKIEAGKMELDFEDVDLKQVIDVALSTAVGLVKDKAVKLLREVPDELPTVRADAVRLRQVLLNLLSNASKFTDEGYIRVTVTRMGDEVMMSVSDTGLGIPPEKQTHLFEAFYQVDGSATRKVGGTGLGLAITKSFVELHGGQIWVESTGQPGEGTAFHVTLPIDGPPEKPGERPVAPLVLAIDDEPGITMLYEKYLVPEGYRFIACHDARKALEEATTLQPQLILLDIRMPQMNGFEVIEGLRQNIVTRDIPVIMCSIESAANIEEQVFQAGASDFLQKPILRQDLIAAAHRWAGAPNGRP